MNEKKVRVLIIDDSALVRRALTDILTAHPDIEVMGAAPDPYDAARLIQKEVPDVMMLDIEMPKMNGITFLRKVMHQHPIPTIICSTLAEKGSRATFAALQAGAIELIHKPSLGTSDFFEKERARIWDLVITASKSRVRRLASIAPPVSPPPLKPKTVEPPSRIPVRRVLGGAQVVALGASTGGTEALNRVLQALPARFPGVVVVQHMPPQFTASFAAWLNERSALEISEARDGDVVSPGRALIAPGSHHMTLQGVNGRYSVRLSDGPPVNRHRPSVDVLFHSVAQRAGRSSAAVIMTGMGDDGAEGLLALKQSGATTIAQDEESCVVFGMPKEAIKRNAADHIMPLNSIAPALTKLCC